MSEIEINDGGTAFPASEMRLGMSLRDYFAASVLQGISSLPDERSCPKGVELEQWRSKIIFDDAKWCYRMADAMLTARGV